MKNKLSKILILVSILLIIGAVFFPTETKAACSFNPLERFYLSDCVASFGNILTGLFGTLIAFSGALLNQSIRITLNIKELYESTPAIDQVWLIIRNLSNIGIIFILLFASISTILDVGKTNIKELVVKIIIAGLLINFSLFFTKVAIDTSNLVSLQFYRAIAPEYDIKKGSALTDGGISDIFMNSLKIQTIYHPPNTGFKDAASDSGKITASIIIGTYGGIVLMLFATLSFFAATIAFSIRTGMLLLLMAFSPVYFVGMIFPKVKSKVSDKWLEYLTNQLLFMPLYLLLMYVALRFISDKSFLSFLSSKDGVTSGPAIYKQIGVAMQYFIAILFINAPLVAAVSFGAIGTKFIGGLIDGVKNKVMGTPSFLAQHSIGRGAKMAQESFNSSGFASRNPNMALLANKAFKNTAEASFGGTKGGFDKRNKEYIKEKTEYGTKSIGLSDRNKKEAMENGLRDWNKVNEALEAKKALELGTLYDPRITDSKIKDEAKKNLAKLELEIKARENAEKTGTRDKYLETEAVKAKKQEFAKNLESGVLGINVLKNPFTKGANTKASKAIRDELNKSEDKKLQDKLKKLLASEEKESEDKPDKGDDKPK